MAAGGFELLIRSFLLPRNIVQLSDKNKSSQVWSQTPISTENKQPEHEALRTVAEMGCSLTQSLSPSDLLLPDTQATSSMFLPHPTLFSWGPLAHTLGKKNGGQWFTPCSTIYVYWACTMCQSDAMLSSGHRWVNRIDMVPPFMEVTTQWRT